MVEILGGSELVARVSESVLNRFDVGKVPTSVEAKTVRRADAPQLRAIHERKRFRVRDEMGIRKRGGWQQVAVVTPVVTEWFPDSGQDAL